MLTYANSEHRVYATATYIHTYTHANIHTYIHAYKHCEHETLMMWVPSNACKPVHTYSHTYTHTYIHTYTHTYIHTYIHAYIHTYKHTYTNLMIWVPSSHACKPDDGAR